MKLGISSSLPVGCVTQEQDFLISTKSEASKKEELTRFPQLFGQSGDAKSGMLTLCWPLTNLTREA